MRHYLPSIFFALLCGMPWHVIASDHAGQQADDDSTYEAKETRVKLMVNGRAIPGRILGEVRGDAGLLQDEFAAFVETPMAAHTSETGTEACAMLCRAPNGAWGAAITTVDSHIFCPLTSKCPDSMEATGVSIHSHPASGKYRINQADWRLSNMQLSRGDFAYKEDPRVFSDSDYSAGPGYMTTGSALFYQSGHGTAREVVVPSPADALASAP